MKKVPPVGPDALNEFEVETRGDPGEAPGLVEFTESGSRKHTDFRKMDPISLGVRVVELVEKAFGCLLNVLTGTFVKFFRVKSSKQRSENGIDVFFFCMEKETACDEPPALTEPDVFVESRCDQETFQFPTKLWF